MARHRPGMFYRMKEEEETVASGKLRATSFLYQTIFNNRNRIIIISSLVSTEDDDLVHRLLCFFKRFSRISGLTCAIEMSTCPPCLLYPQTASSVPLVQELP
mmetsp:Transcript_22764/g.74371  ORF Transcript_22764/g.74371 Transcript_22764/m.74371 type:complete len:102 (-) Transcript_22764:47-352(-)